MEKSDFGHRNSIIYFHGTPGMASWGDVRSGLRPYRNLRGLHFPNCKLGDRGPAVGTGRRMAPLEATPTARLQLELETASDHGCPECGHACRELTEGLTYPGIVAAALEHPQNHT